MNLNDAFFRSDFFFLFIMRTAQTNQLFDGNSIDQMKNQTLPIQTGWKLD